MDLSYLKVAALATNGFEEVEFTQPRQALIDAGATVDLVSPESGKIRSWDTDDWGELFHVDVPLEEAEAASYHALLLPGGVISPDSLRTNDTALHFIRHFFSAEKPVAVICHGSQTMISADLVKDRTMTCYKSIVEDVKNAGAKYVDQEVVVDGQLVSSRNPDDIPAFNEAMLTTFAKVPG